MKTQVLKSEKLSSFEKLLVGTPLVLSRLSEAFTLAFIAESTKIGYTARALGLCGIDFRISERVAPFIEKEFSKHGYSIQTFVWSPRSEVTDFYAQDFKVQCFDLTPFISYP